MTEHNKIFGMKCASCRKDCSLNWTIYFGTLLHPDCISDWNLKQINPAWRGKND